MFYQFIYELFSLWWENLLDLHVTRVKAYLETGGTFNVKIKLVSIIIPHRYKSVCDQLMNVTCQEDKTSCIPRSRAPGK